VTDKLARAQRAASEGLPQEAYRQTVAQFLTHWLEQIAKPRLRPRTFQTYDEVVRLHVVPYLGRVALGKLTPQRVQAWLNNRATAGVSPRRCQYARAVLRTALQQAVKWNLVARNAAALVDPPRVVQREITPLDPTQCRTLLEACNGHRLGPLFTVAVALGLRKGEMLGLRWNDVDLAEGVLHVRQALQRRNGAVCFVEPKSRRSRRTVTLPAVVKATLDIHRVRQLEERMVAGGRWVESGLVFTTRVGTPLDERNVTKEFQRLLQTAGLPHIRLHDLRHTAATLLLAQGVNPRVVMETLGHSQISLTLDTYSHVLPTLQQDAADQMDAALGMRS
jgi:integrase